MANWKKIIVSGSIADLDSALVDNLVQVSNNQIISSSADETKLSGSFSGSFQGDGSLLTGLVTVLEISGSSQAGETFGTVDLLDERFNIVGGEGIDLTFDDNTNILDISGQDATSTNKGIATFNTEDFVVTDGDVTLADSLTGAVLTIEGTANEVEVSRSLGTVTVGLPDDVTITNDLTVEGNISGSTLEVFDTAVIGGNVTVEGTSTFNDDVTIAGTSNLTVSGNASIAGDLLVSGDVTAIQTTNLEVTDRFILLNSGSTFSGTQKGGIIVDENGGVGAGFIYNATDDRWGFNRAADANEQTGIQSEAYVATVIEGEAGQFDDKYEKVGNIRVDAQGDIFIYV